MLKHGNISKKGKIMRKGKACSIFPPRDKIYLINHSATVIIEYNICFISDGTN